jgi:branched-chain amino acid transport system substrate-binding protein
MRDSQNDFPAEAGENKKMKKMKRLSSVLFAMILACSLGPVAAQPKYDPGASDTEIRIGNIVPYSGPASVYSVYGKVFEGYFNRVNEHGGIGGRKIRLLSYDDAYSPPKTVEQARRLVEGDEVLFLFGGVGTPTNAAILKYMNVKKVPLLYAASGSSLFADPEHYPWAIGFQPNYEAEGRMYASYILANQPSAKIAVLYQFDDFGKDLLKGLSDGLGDKAATMVVGTSSYDVATPSIDSQILQLKASGADVLMDFTTPKFATQAIRKVAEIGWKPTHFVASVASHVGSVLKPAGFENAVGVMTGRWVKDPNDPATQNDAGIVEWRQFMKAYYPGGDQTNAINVIAYVLAQTLEHMLRNCGDDLSRENILKQATSLEGFESDLLISGVKIRPSPRDYLVVRDLQMGRFDGESYRQQGPLIEMKR